MGQDNDADAIPRLKVRRKSFRATFLKDGCKQRRKAGRQPHQEGCYEERKAGQSLRRRSLLMIYFSYTHLPMH